ncbi:MAG: hypothetical protein COA57_14355 [Flavobacteriales bacterium]|nr:tail fiber domain-containing protein [Bacteroidales bacterium AH-315-I05]PCJ81350.1 MAG: hypothetical protein COA57_14355 [Flavobacteriales bacterium]
MKNLIFKTGLYTEALHLATATKPIIYKQLVPIIAFVIITVLLLTTNTYSQSIGINDDGIAPPAGINVEIDFDKAGDATAKTWLLIDGDIITANQTANLTGLDINLSDGAFNSTATNIGLNVDLSGLTGGTNYAGIFMGGNVGIGTTVPYNRLSLHQPSSAFVNLQFTNSTTGNTSATDGFRVGLDSNEDGVIIMNTSGSDLYFCTEEIRRMTILNNGYVGVGTPNPTSLLTLNIANASSQTQKIEFLRSNAVTAGGLTSRSNTSAVFRISLDDQTGSETLVVVSGNVGIGTTTPDAKLTVSSNARIGTLTLGALTGNSGERFNLIYDAGVATYRINGATVGVNTSFGVGGVNDVMYLKATTQNVGIGTITPNAKLQVNGSVNCTGGTCSSDIRWKKNVIQLENTLDKVSQLRGVTYNWRKQKFPDKNFNSKKQIGLIAQEVEKVYPELVNIDNEGFMSMDYMSFTVVLLEAIKDQQRIIQQLQKETEEIKTENQILNQKCESVDDLHEKVRALENMFSRPSN